MNTTTPITTNSTASRIAYSVQEAAQMLGVCDKSIRRLILRGLLRPSRALRHILIPKDELDRFLRDAQGVNPFQMAESVRVSPYAVVYTPGVFQDQLKSGLRTEATQFSRNRAIEYGHGY